MREAHNLHFLRWLPVVAFVLVASIAVVTAPEARTTPTAVLPASANAETSHAERFPSLAICEVFGDRYCGAALRVSWCESRFDTRARNGQYRGLFQMGRWERRTFGHGPTALAQARAAYRYFFASGRDWSPWECRP